MSKLCKPRPLKCVQFESEKPRFLSLFFLSSYVASFSLFFLFFFFLPLFFFFSFVLCHVCVVLVIVLPYSIFFFFFCCGSGGLGIVAHLSALFPFSFFIYPFINLLSSSFFFFFCLILFFFFFLFYLLASPCFFFFCVLSLFGLLMLHTLTFHWLLLPVLCKHTKLEKMQKTAECKKGDSFSITIRFFFFFCVSIGREWGERALHTRQQT